METHLKEGRGVGKARGDAHKVDSCLEMIRAQKLCENGGGRPELPLPNSPHGIGGRKATFEELKRSKNKLAFVS